MTSNLTKHEPSAAFASFGMGAYTAIKNTDRQV